jgi:hypothetical protein
MQDGRRLLLAAALVGFGTSFKYSPVLLLLFLPLAFFDRPVRSRLLTLGITAVGLALGFVLACPSALVHPGHFITLVSREAHHYAFLGHPSFDADDPGPAMLHNLYVRAPYWGNFLLAAFAVVGAAVALVRGIRTGRYRETWLLLGAPALSLGFLFSQFVQFGRNYLPFVAFACVLAGLGADALLSLLRRTWPSRPGTVSALAAAATVLILSVGFECLTGSGLWGDPPNARAQAVAWVNDQAPLGSRVLLVEPPLGTLDSATVDGARFRVRRPSEVPGLRSGDFDFVLGAGELSDVRASERRAFEGPGSFGLPTRYTVARVEPGERRALDLAGRRAPEAAAPTSGDEPE